MLPTTDWRERTEFLDKRTLYVFSLELRLQISIGQRVVSGERLRAVAADPTRVAADVASATQLRAAPPPIENLADTYHVLNDELTTTVDGAVHELPLARVVDLQDWLTARGMGTFDLDGRVRLSTHDHASISMLYGGVLRLGWQQGDLLAVRQASPRGSAQLVARFEVDRPKYRWLSQAQLIGFAEAKVADALALRPPAAAGVAGIDEPIKVLTLSVDFYSAL